MRAHMSHDPSSTRQFLDFFQLLSVLQISSYQLRFSENHFSSGERFEELSQ